MPALSIELEKLYRKGSTRILVVIFALMTAGLAVLYSLGELRFGISLMNTGQFPSASLAWLMGLILPFMALYISGVSYSEEFSRGTIHTLQLLPITRTQLFIGKQLAVMVVLGALLLGHFGLSTVFGIAIDGAPGAFQLFAVLGEHLGAWLVLGLIALLGSLLALLVQSSGLTLVVAYAGYIALSAVGLYLPWFSKISLVTLLGDYGNLLVAFHWTQLFTMLAYYIMVSMLGLMALDKRLA